jgi:ribonuclease VapC
VIIDSSALLAILLGEPEATAMVNAIGMASVRLVPAPTLVEASAVLVARKGPSGELALDALLQRLALVTVAMTPAAADCARDGFRRFGKGIGNPGVLNFGDCLAYGVAKATGHPLLCKGLDFIRTDVAVVEYGANG